MIQQELFNLLREFTQRTNVWQEEISFLPLTNVYDYLISPTEQGYINRLIWVEGARSATNPMPLSGPPQQAYLPAYMQTGGVLPGAPGTNMALVRIISAPSNNPTWYAHVALTIADPTDAYGIPVIPDWIVDKYYMPLLDGTLSRMMGMPSKPYSNSALAAYHAKRYNTGLNLCRNEMAHGNAVGGQSWRFPSPSGRSRSQKY
jgi:hypothetical protein